MWFQNGSHMILGEYISVENISAFTNESIVGLPAILEFLPCTYDSASCQQLKIHFHYPSSPSHQANPCKLSQNFPLSKFTSQYYNNSEMLYTRKKKIERRIRTEVMRFFLRDFVCSHVPYTVKLWYLEQIYLIILIYAWFFYRNQVLLQILRDDIGGPIYWRTLGV